MFPTAGPYTWIGVDWNHKNHSVRIASKTRNNLPQQLPHAMTVHELERLVSAVSSSPAASARRRSYTSGGR